MQKEISFSRRSEPTNEIRRVRDSSSCGFKPCEFRSSTTGKSFAVLKEVLSTQTKFCSLHPQNVRLRKEMKNGGELLRKRRLGSRKELTMSPLNLLRSRSIYASIPIASRVSPSQSITRKGASVHNHGASVLSGTLFTPPLSIQRKKTRCIASYADTFRRQHLVSSPDTPVGTTR